MRLRRLLQWITCVVLALAGIASAGASPALAAPRALSPAAMAQLVAKTAPPSSATADPQQCDVAYQRYGACYDYAGGIAETTNQGASVSFPVAAPTLAYNGYHTLVEMAVFNRTSTGIDEDTAEIGWIVDSQSSGQPPVPYLFIYHFVNTQGTCYDACGFVSTSKTIKPGMALTPGTQVTWTIHNLHNRWTFYVNGTRIGYIPDSAYKGTFPDAAQVNVYGEIAGEGDHPGCTQMGNGLFGTQSDSETLGGLHLFGAGSQPGLTPYYPTDPAAWNSETITDGLRVGGPGNCLPMAGTVSSGGGGYTVVGRNTAQYTFPAGQNPWFRPSTPPAAQESGAGKIVGVARDPATGGYWMTDDQGDVYAVNAPSYGGLNGVQTPAPIVGIAAFDSGYVLVTAAGNVYAFNAPNDGGLTTAPSSPVVGITASGNGYLIASADGTVHAVHTTAPGPAPAGVVAPVTAIAADGNGYLLVNSLGDVYAVSTPNRGSLAGTEIPKPIIAITPTSTGYVLTDSIGNVYPFHTPFSGSVTNEGI